MPDGFDARPAELHRGAAGLRDDADALDQAGDQVGTALEQAGGAAGAGPLAGAATEFADQLDRVVQATLASLADCAGALDTSANQYVLDDTGAASGLGGVMLPGFDRPR
ncbi:hypothetical protein LQ327_31420 [Actinomycetospora endophytica]|uniref:Excreted virulence factor EspC (Type VII ESX diderm) n=1 Tax=Actinomycetospora endophytica TaxID=2291215 RepID=A0ABS8PLN2_9PSEU|nr:hypothetical protein [Actinomycetospora endophytica]MCD2197889.1 hypothetical protein [Actinomycetospora endophytica]